jgi:muramoyltetrapeptide carboxypeptidase
MRPLTPLAAVLTMTSLTAPTQTDDWIAPPALRPGDTIAIVAPANSTDQRDFEEIAAVMEGWGYRVRLASNLEVRHGNLAGEDEARAQAFMDAWLDPEVRMVWCATGGYGTTRLFEHLDFDAIRANPRILAGMSDITGLHLAIGREARLITFLGPNAIWPIIRDEAGPCLYAERWTWRALREDQYLDESGNPLPPGYTYEFPAEPRDEAQAEDVLDPPKTIAPGVARGRLVGGNLSLVASTVGTPWQIETEGRLLVLEDVREAPYRVDRMLCQLDLAGLLDDCAGVILGTWRLCSPDEPARSLSLDQVFHHYFADRDYPVMANFPTGHMPEQAMLPMGCLAELDAGGPRLTLLENPVTLTR